MKNLVALLLLGFCALAQQSPPSQVLYYYSGSNLQYTCEARASQVNPSTITVSAASNASPVSFTATAHGLDYQSGATITPVVTITGATGNWTPINGTWQATPTSANAFTIAIDSSGFGALTGTLVVTTLSPRTTLSQWLITKYAYNGSNAIIAAMTGRVAPGVSVSTQTGPSSTMNQICGNRAASSMAYQ